MSGMPFVSAIVVAAGAGLRMGGTKSKQFLFLQGKEILAHTVEVFESADAVGEIIIVTQKEEISAVKEMELKYGWKKIRAVLSGGKERKDSVYKGIQEVKSGTEILLIHDGVRPFVTKDLIERSILEAKKTGACVVGVPAKDTIKVCNEVGIVVETPERNRLWQIQTPQTFRCALIRAAYEKAEKEDFFGTDDASIAEFFGAQVKVIPGSYRNMKITTPEDLTIAACFLREEEK